MCVYSKLEIKTNFRKSIIDSIDFEVKLYTEIG